MKKQLLSLFFVIVFGAIHSKQNNYYRQIAKVEKENVEHPKEKLSPFNATFPDAGTYVVEVVSNNYCSDLMKIEIGGSQDAPTAIVGPTTVCPGVPNTYSVTVPDGSVAHWQVTNGNILGAATGAEIQVDFIPGIVPFEVIVWFEKDDCRSQEFVLNVQPEIPDLNFTAGATSVCGSSYEMYEVADPTAETYFWEIIPSSAGSVASGQNTNQVYILWNQAALTNVEVKVTARKCQVFFENSLFVEIIQSPQITVGGDTDACVGQPATFNVNLPTGASFTDITWDFGDGTTAGPITNSTSVTHEYKAPLSASTNYTVTAAVTGVNGCAMTSMDSYVLTVSPSPAIAITPTVVDLCFNTTTTIIAVNQQGGFSATDQIQWFKNGADMGVNSPSINVANAPGNYHAEVTNVFGCTAITSVVQANDCGNGGPHPCDSANTPPTRDFDYNAAITGCGEVTINISNITGTYTNSYFNAIPVGASVLTNNPPQQLVLGNLLNPGVYHVGFVMEFPFNGTTCSYSEYIEFTIPYSAGLKYNISCAGNGQYDVNILNYSEYYPLTPPTQFEFTTDNGTTWQMGTVVNDVAQLNTQLAPGTYQVGIRVSGSGHPPCTAFETLVVPALPNAAFTFDAGCENEAVQFYAPPTTEQGLQYKWIFNGFVTNLQKNPVKTFSAGQSHSVKLIVTNKYDCSVSHTEQIVVDAVDLGGELLKSPGTDCEGGNITLTFLPDNTMPSKFEWYKDKTTSTPYAVTTNPTLNVTENGQYYVFVQGTNGCWEYGNSPISVGFVQAPDPPIISGEPVVCSGNDIQLNVPKDLSVDYEWHRDGQPITQWNDENEITDNQPPGTYVYTVFATVTVDGVSCTSNAGSFTVNVVPPPVTPQIQMDIESCSPYEVKVYVANAQPGVTYYWSNGETGVNTTMTHDGPIRVRSEVNNCIASAQADLPTDLEALAWIFPKGCYSACNIEIAEGYILGPLDGFYNWQWLRNQQVVSQGNGSVQPLSNYILWDEYSLFLDNGLGQCSLEIGTMEASYLNCESCHIAINLGDARCLNINGSWAYEIPVYFNNNQGSPIWASLSVLSNQGYFTNSTVQLLPGGSSHVFYYFPQNFTGGNLDISITGINEEGHNCYDEITINLPQCPPPPTLKLMSLENISMKVYPNPTSNRATVFHKLSGEAGWYDIRLTDMNGKRLQSQQPKTVTGKLFFDCSGLQAGTYHVSLLKHGHTVITVKLIVE